ncbi:hypothetical protein CONPUDRAFT_154955 [Coniophora puteana RWD-64-598 SS2]|uniref:Uncharacterized protein n=1 Tax=Coniophora puteana (strain RWD-64-598) TaxID=741705 RepID=A0A5M3MKG2_CONPW|nr:uncharacterized protein CONPUDRAFT_154955 [Coniophora puteana RWD-64-598 SS2]EIW79556.1 hypothetical protein CONPUDRAFT_154955 [Coniophora puteana RWD-64-598 SS2]
MAPLRQLKPPRGELDELSIYGFQRDNVGGDESVCKRPWWRKMLHQNATAPDNSTPEIHSTALAPPMQRGTLNATCAELV